MDNKFHRVDTQFINTYEAYSKEFYSSGRSIVVPYINVSLLKGNSITSVLSYTEYSYLVFTGVTNIKINSANYSFEIVYHSEKYPVTEEYITMGGVTSLGVEAIVSSKEAILIVPSFAGITERPDEFIPIDTPRFKKKMELSQVSKFFSFENMPSELNDILGAEFITIKC